MGEDTFGSSILLTKAERSFALDMELALRSPLMKTAVFPVCSSMMSVTPGRSCGGLVTPVWY
jgi:hypothetical protein